MLRKILAMLVSTKFTAVLLIFFAAAMATGTFVESNYNTQTARALIYNAAWFELILLLLVINFIGNIRRYKLWRLEKLGALILHLAFIVILIGAGWTRYIGYEGTMPIQEQDSTNVMYSSTTYLMAKIEDENSNKTFSKALHATPINYGYPKLVGSVNGSVLRVAVEDYLMNYTTYLEPDSSGVPYLKVVEASNGLRRDHYLAEGNCLEVGRQKLSFNTNNPEAINVFWKEGKYYLKLPHAGNSMSMNSGQQQELPPDSLHPLKFRTLYSIGDLQFVFPQAVIFGQIRYRSHQSFETNAGDALRINVAYGGGQKDVVLPENQKFDTTWQRVDLEGNTVKLKFGKRIHQLPFYVKVDDFIAEKYPGTENSYSAFESKVTVIDSGQSFPARIYMNHVLDYRGYRFFQSSFFPDEMGTILSVNHDLWGTRITYLGYFLLYFGLIYILLSKRSRFGHLRSRLNSQKKKPATYLLFLLVLLGSTTGQAQTMVKSGLLPRFKADSLITAHKVSKAHASQFGHLVIQDAQGRMKPVNTFTSEFLRKVSKREEYQKMNPDQVFLSMIQFPKWWYSIPIISLKRGNKSLRKVLDVDAEASHVAITDFFDAKGQFKLRSEVAEAYRASVPSQFQKDLMEVDRKLSLLFFGLSGQAMKVFPIPGHDNNKWITPSEVGKYELPETDSIFIGSHLTLYLASLFSATKTNSYKKANENLLKIKEYQNFFGKEVIPSESKIEAEVLYNRYDVFKKLFVGYMLAGLLLVVFSIINIVKTSRPLHIVLKSLQIGIFLMFLLHSVGLIARWYISGHAPWSDAYESMIYVGWSTVLFGLLFGRASKITTGATSFVAAMILMVAHWQWLDPAITNLQPVLNSYWLMIHVAIIVASYGPFALGMILGVVTLVLMIVISPDNRSEIKSKISQLQRITEISITIGLVMLTIGNFLGGQWANESWGRYWGWDPKETWAMISIIVYAFVIHMRLIPGLRGRWIFSLMSIVAFYSILMTYFGVNFYLTGLHSYASGEKVVTPSSVYLSVVILIALGWWSFENYRRIEHKAE